MLRMSGSAHSAPAGGSNTPRANQAVFTSTEAWEIPTKDVNDSREVISPAKRVTDSKEVAQCQATVCARLRDEGWDARVVSDETAEGVVTAEYREKKAVILCMAGSAPVGDDAVHGIYAYCCHQGADYSAIVSSAPYTISELRLALGTRVLLLQPDQVHLLQELIFGMTAIEPQTIFRVVAEEMP
jgi:hypothetical protein